MGSEAAVGRRRGDPKIRREKDHVLKELDFNKQLNEQVMRNQADLREQVAAARAAEAAAKAEVAAAQDDLRDLTFHLEAQAKIVAEGGGGGELSGGDLAGVTPKPERRKGKGKVRS